MGVFPTFQGTACRSCGATRAAPKDNRFGVCEHCYKSYRKHVELAAFRHDLAARDFDNDNQFNAWLASRLMRDVKRLKSYGVTGRCEALSGNFYTTRGHQCCGVAIALRDGRPVCHAHHRRAETVAFIDAPTADCYERFSSIMRDLANSDPKFRAALREALV